MASLIDQYGIREVADVTLWALDGSGAATVPVLFFDSLKISSLEFKAEQTEAKGGKGNSPLIIWDYGKEITVTLQDALFTPASMAVMYGGVKNSQAVTAGAIATTVLWKMSKQLIATGGLTQTPAATVAKYYPVDGTTVLAPSAALTIGKQYYVETAVLSSSFTSGSQNFTIDINADAFPGTYKLVGDTIVRNKLSGIDEPFQFTIAQAKMGVENKLSLEAAGDATVFDMTLRVLRPATGAMMTLTKY